MLAKILAALMALSPRPSAHPFPGWLESDEAHKARLEAIADDVAAVARTETEAALLVGVAWHESGFAPDVDAGDCYITGGWAKRCDSGRAVSLWQLQFGDAERRELARKDRRYAAQEALRRLLGSLASCGGGGPRLALYAGGACNRGHKAAVELEDSVKRAKRLMNASAK